MDPARLDKLREIALRLTEVMEDSHRILSSMKEDEERNRVDEFALKSVIAFIEEADDYLEEIINPE